MNLSNLGYCTWHDLLVLPSLSLPTQPSIYLPTCLSASLYVPLCLSIYLPTCLPLHPPVCLRACLLDHFDISASSFTRTIRVTFLRKQAADST